MPPEFNRDLHFPELPHYLRVEAVCRKDIVKIFVHSTIHVNKTVELPTSYSYDYFRDSLADVKVRALGQIVRRYGLKPEPLRYS
jgi:hypothetical protein